jgi:crotonobetainyl-CoA:carnitine CoA-transferase CaiB-like acyl-CoA transferase
VTVNRPATAGSREPRPLDGVRVLELASTGAVGFAGRLLGGLGAEVLKVEPPGGDPSRSSGPAADPARAKESTSAHLFLNADKRSRVIDLDRPHDVNVLRRLLRAADIAITDVPDRRAVALALDHATLARANVGLITVHVSAFGRSGPRAHWRAHPLNTFHAGGEGFLVPGGLAFEMFPERPPVQAGGALPDADVGLTAAFGALGALAARDHSGRGQLVEVSGQEAELGLNRVTIERWANEGTLVDRRLRAYDWGGCMACADGWVIIRAAQDHQWAQFIEVAGLAALRDSRFATRDGRREHGAEIDATLRPWVATQGREDLYHRFARAGIPAGFFASVADVLASPQMEARGFFAEVEHPVAGKAAQPVLPFHLGDRRPRAPRPAPILGSDDGGWAKRRRRRSQGRPGRRRAPLAGVRVLEFGWFAAGPYAGMLLGMLGAEVIKIESRRRIDGFRLGVYGPTTDENASPTFHALNMNKQSCLVDIATDRGRDLALRLAAKSDIVLDNFRPGVMEKLGLGPTALLGHNPRLIVAAESAGGSTGPEHTYPGFASVFSALSGLGYMSGYPDGPPVEIKESNDLRVATMFAVGILAALQLRARTGRGTFVDLSARETLSALVGEAFVEYAVTGRVPGRVGNADRAMSPHGVYRCRGDDSWVSIAIGDVDEWHALCRVMDRPDLASALLATPDARRERGQEIDLAIEAWTATRTAAAAAEALQAAGVPAVPSYTNRDLFEDAHLRRRGVWRQLQHERLGGVWAIGSPIRFHGTPATIRRSAPLIGADTDQILRRVLGLSPGQIGELREIRVLH